MLIILRTKMIFWGRGQAPSTTPQRFNTYGALPLLTEILNTPLASTVVYTFWLLSSYYWCSYCGPGESACHEVSCWGCSVSV